MEVHNVHKPDRDEKFSASHLREQLRHLSHWGVAGGNRCQAFAALRFYLPQDLPDHAEEEFGVSGR